MNIKIAAALGFCILSLSAVCNADQAVPDSARERFWNENAVVYALVAEAYIRGGGLFDSELYDLEVLATVAGRLDSSLLATKVRIEAGPVFAKKGDHILAFVTRTDKGTLGFVPSITGIFPSGGVIEIVAGLDDPKGNLVEPQKTACRRSCENHGGAATVASFDDGTAGRTKRRGDRGF
jgi:hypothetical protein